MKLIKQAATLWITGNKEYKEYYISNSMIFYKDFETTLSLYVGYMVDFIFNTIPDRREFEKLLTEYSIKYTKYSQPKDIYAFSESIKVQITKQNYPSLAEVLEKFKKLGYKSRWKVGIGVYIIM